MRIISWNLCRRVEAWRRLLDSGADIALLQEAAEPPADVAACIQVDSEPWTTAGPEGTRPWRAAVVGLGSGARLEWLKPMPIGGAGPGEFAVSRFGTVSAAHVELPDGSRLVVASVYGMWESPHASTGSRWIFADASVHRLVSDLAALVGREQGHRVLVAGDFNILHGCGDDGSPYWAGRYGTVFARMEALGLPFVGPQRPNGRCADPWPAELPKESLNVPTYYTASMTPATDSGRWTSSSRRERWPIASL